MDELAMDNSPTTDPIVRRLSWATLAATPLMLVASPLLALAYHATSDGAPSGEAAVVQAWAVPVREAIRPLLEFADADTVYRFYTAAVMVAAVGLVSGVLALRRAHRAVMRRGGRVCLGLAAAGYSLMLAGTAVASLTPATDLAFIALLVPGMLLTLVGSTAVGVWMLYRRAGPVASRVLLAAAIPGFVVISTVGGHNAVGMASIFVGWAIVGVWLLRLDPTRATASSDTVSRASSRL